MVYVCSPRKHRPRPAVRYKPTAGRALDHLRKRLRAEVRRLTCGPFRPHPDHKGHRALAPMLAPNISRLLHMAPFARGRLLRALSGGRQGAGSA